ncbi:hypothetical protein CAAN3_08S06326 [[Candida] anglica]
MTSLPNPSPLTSTSVLLSTPPVTGAGGKRHRHRRSAAISGDFDAMGLGLFSPPSTSNHPSRKPSIPDFDLDKNFHFNNQEDFAKPDKTMDFSFPNRPSSPETLDDYHTASAGSPRTFTSPPKKHYTHSTNLNSPIRLARKSASVHLAPKTRFFLTEETNINNENVPDAVIDLDEVLSANLHIGEQSTGASRSSSVGHTRSESAPFDMYSEEDSLSSPFLRSYASPFISSPLSSSNNHLFQQPIQEQFTDDIEEISEEPSNTSNKLDSLGAIFAVDDHQTSSTIATPEEELMFPNPQSALVGLYSNDSANSSSSSLRSNTTRIASSHHSIEKSFSNDSTNYCSNHSNTNLNSTPGSSKRSGAKATRYQSFYDQSYKISNALKVSSSESINIYHDDGTSSLPKEIRILGHSSSLPSLKTTSTVKRNNQKLPRFGEIYRFVPAAPTASIQQTRLISPPPTVKSQIISQQQFHHPVRVSQSNPNNLHNLSKNVSNSPISMNSEVSSTIISSNATIQSTDHSSLHDQSNSFASKAASENTVLDAPPSIVVSSSEDVSAGRGDTTTPVLDQGIRFDQNSNTTRKNIPPPITVANVSPTRNGVSTSTVAASTSTSTSTSTRSSRGSPKKSTIDKARRPLSPQEESFLKETQIPSFRSKTSKKVENQQHNTHQRTKSRSSISQDENDDLNSLRSANKRNSRFINWLKKR